MRKAFDARDIHKLRIAVRASDWDTADIPADVALKLFAICTAEQPRFASLCITQYNAAGKDEIDCKSCIAVIQGQTVVDAHSFLQLLGWRIVDQRFNDLHVTFGFHGSTAAAKAQLISIQRVFIQVDHIRTQDETIVIVYC